MATKCNFLTYNDYNGRLDKCSFKNCGVNKENNKCDGEQCLLIKILNLVEKEDK